MRRTTKRFLHAAVTAAAAASLLACGGDRGASSDSARAGGAADTSASAGGGTVERHSVQLASLTSLSAAEALRDSLARAGWSAFVSEATVDDTARWRVQALPTESAELARLAAFALRAGGRDALATSGRAPAPAANGPPAVARVHRVSNGTKGMARTLRWTFSPDHQSLIAVDDPVSVEAEALADGFVYVSESGAGVVQIDSVWDVAPSPDWSWLAYAHAHRSRVGEAEQPSDAQWADLARRAGLTVEETKRRAFPVSGMAYISAVAVPAVRRVADGAADASERRLDVAAGWRAAWSTTGALAAFGAAPRMVQDDSPAPWYVLVDPQTGASRDTVRDASVLASVPWIEGPTLDISIPFDHDRRRTVEGGSRTIVSEDGWVRVREREEGGPGRIVGPGSVLAATAGGRFVLVLVLDPAAREYESPDLAVVYELEP